MLMDYTKTPIGYNLYNYPKRNACIDILALQGGS